MTDMGGLPQLAEMLVVAAALCATVLAVAFLFSRFFNSQKTRRRIIIGAAVLCFGLVIPGMNQIWFTGPIAKTTGDIGFEVALVLSALLYVPLRYVEQREAVR